MATKINPIIVKNVENGRCEITANNPISVPFLRFHQLPKDWNISIWIAVPPNTANQNVQMRVGTNTTPKINSYCAPFRNTGDECTDEWRPGDPPSPIENSPVFYPRRRFFIKCPKFNPILGKAPI